MLSLKVNDGTELELESYNTEDLLEVKIKDKSITEALEILTNENLAHVEVIYDDEVAYVVENATLGDEIKYDKSTNNTTVILVVKEVKEAVEDANKAITNINQALEKYETLVKQQAQAISDLEDALADLIGDGGEE